MGFVQSRRVAAVLRGAGLTMPMERSLCVVAQVEQYSLLMCVCTRSAGKSGTTCRVSELSESRNRLGEVQAYRHSMPN